MYNLQKSNKTQTFHSFINKIHTLLSVDGTMKCSGPLSQVPVNWVFGLSGAGCHSFYCTSNGWKADMYPFSTGVGWDASGLAHCSLLVVLSIIFMSLNAPYRNISCDGSLSLLLTEFQVELSSQSSLSNCADFRSCKPSLVMFIKYGLYLQSNIEIEVASNAIIFLSVL